MGLTGRRYLVAVAILLAASFVINLGFSALSPVFPYLILALKGVLKELPELTKGVIEAHKGAVELGLLTAAFMVVRAPIAGVIGVVSDVLGRKRRSYSVWPCTLLPPSALYYRTTFYFSYFSEGFREPPRPWFGLWQRPTWQI